MFDRLPVDEFMQLAISEYYANNNPFGVEGDFITAPEISQMFGEVIGAWIVFNWREKGGGSFNLVEIGGGRGTLMYDILTSTKVFKDFHEALNSLYMVESSQALGKLQKNKLKEFDPIVLKDVSEIESQNNIIFCNEFFDALPIKQFHSLTKEERFVINDGGLRFNFGEEYIIESSPASLNYANKIADKIKGGFALIVDYGYIEPPMKSTMQAVKNHKYHDVLQDIGKADITALVDFKALKSLFEGMGFNANLSTQSEFLIRNGIMIRADLLIKSGANPQTIEQDLNRLISKSEMGELFKVLEIF